MAEESAVNSQILDSVHAVHALLGGAAADVARGVSQQQVASALGMAVQNAVAHLQSLQTLDVAVTAQALSLALQDPEEARAVTLTLELMQRALRFAVEQVAELSRLAGLPPPATPPQA
jgi:killing trait domain-containing protein